MTNQNLDILRQSPEPLLGELRLAGAIIDNPKQFCCPYHQDQHPSAGIWMDEQGIWRFKCFTCGEKAMDVFDLQARREGRPIGDVLKGSGGGQIVPPKPAFPSLEALAAVLPQPTTIYRYGDHTTGKLTMAVVRSDPPGGRKRFCQCRPIANGWIMEAPPAPWRLYNSIRVATANQVLVVEGEKTVDALRDIGIVATTSPGGAGKAEHADWSILAGKNVLIWPDNDPPDPKTGRRMGLEHMDDVQAILEALEPSANIYRLDPDTLNLPPKGDAYDFIAALGNIHPLQKKQAVEAIYSRGKQQSASGDQAQYYREIAAGQHVTISWPWPKMTGMTRALQEGTVTLLVGDPGCGKTYWLLACLVHWSGIGIKSAVYMLEEDKRYHNDRTLAVITGEPGLTESDWIRSHYDLAVNLNNIHSTRINEISRCITAAPEKQVTADSIVAWAETMASRGARLLIVDPITVITGGDKPWVVADGLMEKFKRIARKYKVSIIVSTHAKKGHKGVCMDDVAGGTSYVRFSQTVIWLDSCSEGEVTVKTHDGTRQAVVNRVAHILKARNGRGGGSHVGFHFENVRFQEQGIIPPKSKSTSRGLTPVVPIAIPPTPAPPAVLPA